jgi:hypothetical protein
MITILKQEGRYKSSNIWSISFQREQKEIIQNVGFRNILQGTYSSDYKSSLNQWQLFNRKKSRIIFFSL